MTRDEAVAELAKIRASANALEAFFLSAAGDVAAEPPKPAPEPPARPPAGLQNPKAFFDHVRGTLWPKLTQDQVQGCEAVLKACAGKMPTSWAAYALATAYHETAYTMQPIKERGSDAYLSKYDTGRLAEALGNTPEADGDGIKYAGRGYVQLTGAANYKRAEAELGHPISSSPDLALRPDIAAEIMVRGMIEGWFTGKGLRAYIPQVPRREHFANARRIINGTDKADQIAGYALSFYEALKAGDWR